MRNSLAVFLLAAIATIPTFTTTAAPITVPSGLNLGDHYRLAFVTSTTRDAISSVIADYNSFVTTDANTVTQLAALGTTWSAIASTAAVPAYDNTLTHPSLNPDYPIYNLAGTLVASSNSGLWSSTGSGLLSGLNFDEIGTIHNVFVWTGSTFTGTAFTGAQLGAANAEEGTSANANSAWITLSTADSHQLQSLYAMSGVLTVVPEPGALALVSLAVAGMISWFQRERRTRSS